MVSADSEQRIFVGQASLRGAIDRYAKSFDMLELPGDPGRHPGRKVLRDWRATVPKAFVFSVVVPAVLSSLESREDREAVLAQAVEMADELAASFWVLRTPATVTPSARSLRALAELIQKLRGHARRIAWEPRGVWSEEELVRAAASLEVTLVRDLAREDPLGDGEVVYTRLRALGEGMRVGAGAAERVAERVMDADAAFVVVEGTGAQRVRQVLRSMIGAAEPAHDGADDEELADDDEDGSALEDE